MPHEEETFPPGLWQLTCLTAIGPNPRIAGEMLMECRLRAVEWHEGIQLMPTGPIVTKKIGSGRLRGHGIGSLWQDHEFKGRSADLITQTFLIYPETAEQMYVRKKPDWYWQLPVELDRPPLGEPLHSEAYQVVAADNADGRTACLFVPNAEIIRFYLALGRRISLALFDFDEEGNNDRLFTRDSVSISNDTLFFKPHAQLNGKDVRALATILASPKLRMCGAEISKSVNAAIEAGMPAFPKVLFPLEQPGSWQVIGKPVDSSLIGASVPEAESYFVVTRIEHCFAQPPFSRIVPDGFTHHAKGPAGDRSPRFVGTRPIDGGRVQDVRPPGWTGQQPVVEEEDLGDQRPGFADIEIVLEEGDVQSFTEEVEPLGPVPAPDSTSSGPKQGEGNVTVHDERVDLPTRKRIKRDSSDDDDLIPDDLPPMPALFSRLYDRPMPWHHKQLRDVPDSLQTICAAISHLRGTAGVKIGMVGGPDRPDLEDGLRLLELPVSWGKWGQHQERGLYVAVIEVFSPRGWSYVFDMERKKAGKGGRFLVLRHRDATQLSDEHVATVIKSAADRSGVWPYEEAFRDIRTVKKNHVGDNMLAERFAQLVAFYVKQP